MISGKPGEKTNQGGEPAPCFHGGLKMMKNIFLCLLLFSVSWVTEASETTFADIQKRVTKRDDIPLLLHKKRTELEFQPIKQAILFMIHSYGRCHLGCILG
jgi:hypothetical protein